MNKTETRKESRTTTFKNYVYATLGTRCTICGSEENIVIHHKIPISKGGSNYIGNIDVLCRDCHLRVHGAENLIATNYGNGGGGRPRRELNKEDKIVMWQYVKGDIGVKEISRYFGIKCTPNKCGWFERYIDDAGIESFDNKIDMREYMHSKGKTCCEGINSVVRYKDGRERVYYSNGEFETIHRAKNAM